MSYLNLVQSLISTKNTDPVLELNICITFFRAIDNKQSTPLDTFNSIFDGIF